MTDGVLWRCAWCGSRSGLCPFARRAADCIERRPPRIPSLRHGVGPVWPDGALVDQRRYYVRLSCGHERVSKGWRGSPGERYCCDVCHRLVTIEHKIETTLPPHGWRLGPPGPRSDLELQIAERTQAAREEFERLFRQTPPVMFDDLREWQAEHERVCDAPGWPWWSRLAVVAIAAYYALRR